MKMQKKTHPCTPPRRGIYLFKKTNRFKIGVINVRLDIRHIKIIFTDMLLKVWEAA
jgi:hypothetical protein